MTKRNTDKAIIPAQPQDDDNGLPSGYTELLDDLKAIVRSARIRAQRAVNTELIQMYWELGQTILERQTREGWGTKVVSRLASDLKTAFPGQRGFSRSNLMYMQKMARTWPDPIVQQPVGQLPWGHIVILMSQVKNRSDLDFYATRAVHEGWSRDQLTRAVAQELHLAQGAAPTNFAATLPEDAKTVQDITKDPYRLDFVVRDPERDDETIGILIGQDHNKAAVRMALDCQRSPIAVSSYEGLPPEQRALLPSEADLARVAQETLDSEQ